MFYGSLCLFQFVHFSIAIFVLTPFWPGEYGHVDIMAFVFSEEGIRVEADSVCAPIVDRGIVFPYHIDNEQGRFFIGARVW